MKTNVFLKERVERVKAQFPKDIDMIPIYEFYFGKLDDKMKQRVRNVWKHRSKNEEITVNLEKLIALQNQH